MPDSDGFHFAARFVLFWRVEVLFCYYLEGVHLDGPKLHPVVNREALVYEEVVVDERADQAEVNCLKNVLNLLQKVEFSRGWSY